MKKTNVLLLIFLLNIITVNIFAQEPVPKSGHTGSVTSVVFSPDGEQIVSGSFDDQYIRIWDVATGQEIRTLMVNDNSISYLNLSPDGKYIVAASTSSSGTINIWDRNTGKELRNVLGFINEYIMSLDISPDGKKIAALYLNFSSPNQEYITKIRLFDINTGKQLKTFLDYIIDISSFAFSPDGKQIITYSFNSSIKFWNTATGKENKSISENVDGINYISFSPDEKYIISRANSKDKNNTFITIWDAFKGMKKNVISSDYFTPIAISPDGNMIAFVPLNERLIRLFDIVKGKNIKTVSDFSGHTDKILSLAFSPDGKMLVSGSDDKSVRLWDVATGKEIRTMGE